MIRTILFWLVFLLSFFVLYFNTMMFLDYMTSMKYEIEHAKAISTTAEITQRENEINKILIFNKIIYGFILLVMVSNFILMRVPKQKLS